MNQKEIGKRLRELRGERKIEEIAELCGVTKSAISNYEQGIRIPKDSIKVKLAQCYGKTVAEIFFN